MKQITFQYRDAASKGKWREQVCICRTMQECKEEYRLANCDYRIVRVRELGRITD